MPKHFTAPPPYDRYGGRIPGCRELPSYISEAEDYLRNMQHKLEAAQQAEERAKALMTELQKAVDQAHGPFEQALKAADQAAGTSGFDAAVAHRDACEKAYRQARGDLMRAENDYYARDAERRALQGEVDKSERWLNQLKAALRNCPPPPPPVVVPPSDGGYHLPPPDGPLGDPEDFGCDGIEQLIEILNMLKEQVEAELEGLNLDLDTAERDLKAATAATKDAQERFLAAQSKLNSLPRSHDAYWDSLDGDGQPIMKYRPNKDYAAAAKEYEAAKVVLGKARTAEQVAATHLQDVVNQRIFKSDELERVVSRIASAEAELAICRQKLASMGFGKRLLIGAGAMALAAGGVFFALRGFGGHDAPASPHRVSVEQPASQSHDGLVSTPSGPSTLSTDAPATAGATDQGGPSSATDAPSNGGPVSDRPSVATPPPADMPQVVTPSTWFEPSDMPPSPPTAAPVPNTPTPTDPGQPSGPSGGYAGSSYPAYNPPPSEGTNTSVGNTSTSTSSSTINTTVGTPTISGGDPSPAPASSPAPAPTDPQSPPSSGPAMPLG